MRVFSCPRHGALDPWERGCSQCAEVQADAELDAGDKVRALLIESRRTGERLLFVEAMGLVYGDPRLDGGEWRERVLSALQDASDAEGQAEIEAAVERCFEAIQTGSHA